MVVSEYRTDESSPMKTDRATLVSVDLDAVFAACAG